MPRIGRRQVDRHGSVRSDGPRTIISRRIQRSPERADRPVTAAPSGQLAVALLVFLARAARAGIVAPDLLAGAHERLRPLGYRDIAFAPPPRLRCRRRPRSRRAGTARSSALRGSSTAASSSALRICTVIRILVTSVLIDSSIMREQLERLALVFLLSGSSARNRADGCPGAGDRAPPGARASAYPGFAA